MGLVNEKNLMMGLRTCFQPQVEFQSRQRCISLILPGERKESGNRGNTNPVPKSQKRMSRSEYSLEFSIGSQIDKLLEGRSGEAIWRWGSLGMGFIRVAPLNSI